MQTKLSRMFAMDAPLLEAEGGFGRGGGGGTGDPGPSGSPTQADVDRIETALKAERAINAEIKRAAAEKGVPVTELLGSLTNSEGSADQVAALQRTIAALEADIAARTGESQAAQLQVVLSEAATKSGARSAAAVVALLKDGITFNDSGNPVGISEAVDALKRSEPALFKHAEGSGDGGRAPRNDADVRPGSDRLAHAYETSSTTASSR